MVGAASVVYYRSLTIYEYCSLRFLVVFRYTPEPYVDNEGPYVNPNSAITYLCFFRFFSYSLALTFLARPRSSFSVVVKATLEV